MAQNINSLVKKLQQMHHDISVKYNEQLKEQVRDLSRNDVRYRILSFMVDAIFMFWPSIIFIISLLLLTSPANIGGEIIRNTFELSVVYVISIFLFNTVSALYFCGQTIGMRYYGLKVVKQNLNELTVPQILIREVLGVSLPWVLILITFPIFNFTVFFVTFFVFIIVNFIFIVLDKKHRSIIDLLMNTKIVSLPYMENEVLVEASNPVETQKKDEALIIEPVAVKEKLEKPANSEKPAKLSKPAKLEKPAKLSKPTKLEKPAKLEAEKPSVKKEEVKKKVEEVEKEVKVEEPKEVKKPKPSIENVIKKVTKSKLREKIKPNINPVSKPMEDSKPVNEVKPVKEKSVSEIISEAVTVVDQALESRSKDFSVNIVKPIKAKEPKVEKAIAQPKEKIPTPIAKKKEETPLKTEVVTSEPKPIPPKKNNKKKNGNSAKGNSTKVAAKGKNKKSISIANKTVKKK